MMMRDRRRKMWEARRRLRRTRAEPVDWCRPDDDPHCTMARHCSTSWIHKGVIMKLSHYLLGPAAGLAMGLVGMTTAGSAAPLNVAPINASHRLLKKLPPVAGGGTVAVHCSHGYRSYRRSQESRIRLPQELSFWLYPLVAGDGSTGTRWPSLTGCALTTENRSRRPGPADFLCPTRPLHSQGAADQMAGAPDSVQRRLLTYFCNHAWPFTRSRLAEIDFLRFDRNVRSRARIAGAYRPFAEAREALSSRQSPAVFASDLPAARLASILRSCTSGNLG